MFRNVTGPGLVHNDL